MNKPIKILKITFFIVIFLVASAYSYYQTKGYLAGPVLEITEPLNNSTQYQSNISIKGNAKNISYISMNGRQIYTNPEGEFEENILLSKGYNIIDISAKDKYERETKKTLKLVNLE